MGDDDTSRDRHNRLPENRFVMHLEDAWMHYKFRKLGKLLGTDWRIPYAMTAALWNWVNKHRPFGVFDDMTDEDVALTIGADEWYDPPDFIAALMEAGLLDRDPETGWLSIHGWQKEGRSGFGAVARSEKASHASHVRWHVQKNSPHPDRCRWCREEQPGTDPDAIGSMPGDAIGSTDSDARSNAPDAIRRRETRDAHARRENAKSVGDREEKKRANENADLRASGAEYSPEDMRPFQ